MLSRHEGESDEAFLVRRAERLLDHAEQIVLDADSDGDRRLGLQAIRETRASVELLMRAKGMMSDGMQIHVDARKQSLSMTKDEVIAAITKFTSTA